MIYVGLIGNRRKKSFVRKEHCLDRSPYVASFWIRFLRPMACSNQIQLWLQMDFRLKTRRLLFKLNRIFSERVHFVWQSVFLSTKCSPTNAVVADTRAQFYESVKRSILQNVKTVNT